MGIFLANGTRVTKGTFPTSAIPAADLPKVVSQDLYGTARYDKTDPKPEGSINGLYLKSGTVLTQKQIDALFPAAKINKLSPASGALAGGTVVTIEGEFLDGVSGVTFGGAAGTALTKVSDRVIKVTTPSGTAGAKDVVVTTDAGPTTKTGGYTYA